MRFIEKLLDKISARIFAASEIGAYAGSERAIREITHDIRLAAKEAAERNEIIHLRTLVNELTTRNDDLAKANKMLVMAARISDQLLHANAQDAMRQGIALTLTTMIETTKDVKA